MVRWRVSTVNGAVYCAAVLDTIQILDAKLLVDYVPHKIPCSSAGFVDYSCCASPLTKSRFLGFAIQNSPRFGHICASHTFLTQINLGI